MIEFSSDEELLNDGIPLRKLTSSSIKVFQSVKAHAMLIHVNNLLGPFLKNSMKSIDKSKFGNKINDDKYSLETIIASHNSGT